MRITRVADYHELSALAASHVLQAVKAKPDLLFCAATGGSPTGMYAEMAKEKLHIGKSVLSKWMSGELFQ